MFLALWPVAAGAVTPLPPNVTPKDIEAEFAVAPGKSGGIYYAYPYTTDSIPPFPAGYEPVYVSHYGRHGSRWAINELQYPLVINLLERELQRGNLTPVGEDVLAKVKALADDARGHAGELSPLGQRQHKAIARRMMQRTPELFADSARISALSSTEPRCIVSMAAFSESLKEQNPGLRITRAASPGDMAFIAYTTPEARAFVADSLGYKKDYREFRERTVDPQRILHLLFKSVPKPLLLDPALKQDKNLNDEQTLIKTLHDIAVTPQNLDLNTPPQNAPGQIPNQGFTGNLKESENKNLIGNPKESEYKGIDLLSLFTTEELFSLWSALNYNMYVRHANSPQGHQLGMQSARSLLDDIITRADAALSASRSEGHSGSSADWEGGAPRPSTEAPVVQLRFGHDTNLIRLLALMQLEGCAQSETDPDRYYATWQDYRISPMAANLQLIFLKNPQEQDPLVLILHNERPALLPISSPTAPFYPWSTLKSLWQSTL